MIARPSSVWRDVACVLIAQAQRLTREAAAIDTRSDRQPEPLTVVERRPDLGHRFPAA